MSSGRRNWPDWKGAPRRQPLGAQSDYWFPTLRSRWHSYVATILCSIRLSCCKKAVKKDDLACFPNQAISKHNTCGVESRPAPECLQGEVTGWQKVAERSDCRVNEANDRLSSQLRISSVSAHRTIQVQTSPKPNLPFISAGTFLSLAEQMGIHWYRI